MKIFKGVRFALLVSLSMFCVLFNEWHRQEIVEGEGITGSVLDAGSIDEKTVLAFDFGQGEILGDEVVDLSGNGNNGKRLNEWAKWVEGRKGSGDQAVSFNADSWTYIGVEKSETLISPKDALTIELWVKLKGALDYPISAYLVNFMSSDGKNGYALGMVKDRLSFSFGNGTNNMYLAVNLKDCLEPDKWQHIAATWNGKEMRIFVDGKKVAETHDPYLKPNISYENVPDRLIIGTRTNAVLDEIRISREVCYK